MRYRTKMVYEHVLELYRLLDLPWWRWRTRRRKFELHVRQAIWHLLETHLEDERAVWRNPEQAAAPSCGRG